MDKETVVCSYSRLLYNMDEYKVITLSEKQEPERSTYFIISFPSISRKCKLSYSEEMHYKGVGGDFWGDEYVPFLDYVDGFISIEICEKFAKLYFLKMYGWVVLPNEDRQTEEKRGRMEGRDGGKKKQTPGPVEMTSSLICIFMKWLLLPL